MAKLARKNQKIFANNATNNGVFGSLQAGSKQTSNDVNVIQSLPAYEEGWNAATISSEKLPPLEELQGVEYANSYQLCYLLQEGIPEWGADTPYYEGAICKVLGTPGNFILYSSLINDNIGNPPATSTSAWKAVFNTEFAFTTEEWVKAQGYQTVANMSQTVDSSTTKYPSNAALSSWIGGQGLQTQGNMSQVVTTSTTQYPSCAAVANLPLGGVEIEKPVARDINTVYTANSECWVFMGYTTSVLGSTRELWLNEVRVPFASSVGFNGMFFYINKGQTYAFRSQKGQYTDFMYYEYPILKTIV